MTRTCAVPHCEDQWPDRDIHTWVISGPASTHEVDLCGPHGQALDTIAALGRTTGTPRGRTEADVMDALWDETRDA